MSDAYVLLCHVYAGAGGAYTYTKVLGVFTGEGARERAHGEKNRIDWYGNIYDFEVRKAPLDPGTVSIHTGTYSDID